MDIELYDFKDHLDSIAWIEELPKGLVSQKIDLRYSAVSITRLDAGFEIYIGPQSNDATSSIEGSGILIRLDGQLKLIDYEIERIAPISTFP